MIAQLPIQFKYKLIESCGFMNYFEIGQRIRRYRKAQNLSQEQLAERIDISVTHMSHIETGNTKLSLPVLVSLAQALEVRTDDLLFDRPSDKDVSLQEMAMLLDECSPTEVRVLVDIATAAKKAFDKHRPNEK